MFMLICENYLMPISCAMMMHPCRCPVQIKTYIFYRFYQPWMLPRLWLSWTPIPVFSSPNHWLASSAATVSTLYDFSLTHHTAHLIVVVIFNNEHQNCLLEDLNLLAEKLKNKFSLHFIGVCHKSENVGFADTKLRRLSSPRIGLVFCCSWSEWLSSLSSLHFESCACPWWASCACFESMWKECVHRFCSLDHGS